jgi:hypothetical protein
MAWARIVFPAPVSPVIAFRPGASSSSASRISTRFSIRSLASKVLLEPLEERRFGRRRQKRRALVQHTREAVARLELPKDWPSATTVMPTSAVSFRTDSVCPRGTTSGRTWSECGATNVTTIASRPQTSTGPPLERL